MKISAYIACSLDGFIAREDDALDWLPGSDGQEGGEDYGFKIYFDSVDAMVMGRHTFEKVLSFGVWPYEGKRVLVLTSKDQEIPSNLEGKVAVRSVSLDILVGEMRASGFQHVYVDGGRTIQGFLRAGLLDEITITRVPVLIGTGIPLFGELAHDVHLRLMASQPFENGFVQSKYHVVR